MVGVQDWKQGAHEEGGGVWWRESVMAHTREAIIRWRKGDGFDTFRKQTGQDLETSQTQGMRGCAIENRSPY